MRAALAVIEEHELLFAMPITLWYAKEALLERPSLADVAGRARESSSRRGMDGTMSGAWLRELRGQLRLQARDVTGRDRGPAPDRADPRGPRTRQPELLRVAIGARAGACRRRARGGAGAGSPGAGPRPARRRCRARSAWLCGRWGCSKADVETLREAAAVLEASPARLEHARALVELGSALRRGNQRAAARDALHAGLDLAVGCGADRLAQRAGDELAASGAGRAGRRRPASRP